MCILSFLLSVVLTTLPAWQKGNLDIHFIATGSGESSLIVMPDGTTVLVDAGQMKVPSVREGMNSAQIIAEYIGKFAPKKNKVDYFYLTHLHSDHMNAVVDLSKLIHIGKIVDRLRLNAKHPWINICS